MSSPHFSHSRRRHRVSERRSDKSRLAAKAGRLGKSRDAGGRPPKRDPEGAGQIWPQGALSGLANAHTSPLRRLPALWPNLSPCRRRECEKCGLAHLCLSSPACRHAFKRRAAWLPPSMAFPFPCPPARPWDRRRVGQRQKPDLVFDHGIAAEKCRNLGRDPVRRQGTAGTRRRRIEQIAGRAPGLVFQDPMTALNPYLTIERQLSEVLQHHRGLSRRAARDEALATLRRVHIPEPARQLDRYPHQLSGGMRQRVIIAMAMIGNPALLLADEPTTALDVTIQAEILDLLAEQRDAGTAIVLVTHDLGVVARVCERVMVMYAGKVVEEGLTAAVFRDPRHPYTQGLLAAISRLDDDICDPRKSIDGQPPDLLELPPGCAFAPRCFLAGPECGQAVPPLLPFGRGGRGLPSRQGRPPVMKLPSPLLKVEGLSVHFPVHGGILGTKGRGSCRAGRQLRFGRRGDLGNCRRVRLRQIHAGPRRSQSDCPDRRESDLARP